MIDIRFIRTFVPAALRQAALVLLMLTVSASAQTLQTNVRMQNVVKAFVQRTGQQLIGLGSWISGTNYNDVLTGGASDHDLRLVIQRSGVTPAQAQQEWQSARRVLRELINNEFGKDANKILGVTNLYPPNQLMKGVEDAADAMQRFQKLGGVPNLGFAGTVDANTPSKFTEGLYGEGAQVWTQMYEQKTGRLFYSADGKVFAGMVDLTHLEEGQAKYSSGGMLNTGVQWIEHAEEELSMNRGDRVAKYLERLDRDLAKAKDMVRLGGDPSLTTEIRDLSQRLKANPAALGSLEGRVTALLARSHMESAILGRLAKSGPIEGAVLKTAMAGIAAKNQFGQALTTAAQNIPVEEVIHGVIAIVVVKSASSTAGEAGYLEALRKESPVLASLPVGVLMGLTNAIVDSAKSGGFELVASYQDPWDLLAGNFTAEGRVSVDEGRPYTIDELVKAIHTEEGLSSFVHTRSVQAAGRGFNGAVTSGTDTSVADAIYERCYTPILRAWQTRREKLRMEYLDTADRLQRTVFPIVVTPASAKLPKGGKVDVMAELMPPKDSTVGRDLDRMKEILTWLNGGRPYTLVTYKWTGGTAGPRETQQHYSFSQGGTQPIVCNVEIVVNESRLQAGDPLIQRVRRFSAVDVEIEGGGPRFIDMANGTMYDTASKLTWLRNPYPCFEYPVKYEAALERARTLASGQCDLTDGSKPGDWRIPTEADYRTLLDTGIRTRHLAEAGFFAIYGPYRTDGFRNGWSTTAAGNGAVWVVDMIDGKFNPVVVAEGFVVPMWAVRTGKNAPTSVKPTGQPVSSPTISGSPSNSSDTKGTDDLLKQGTAFYNDKKYEDALAAFNRVLSTDPKNSDALLRRAMTKRALNNFAGALEDSNNLIRLDPTNERAWLGRGITKERMKDVAGALADYDHAIALNPIYALVYEYRGNLELNQENYRAALADFNRQIELDPENGTSFNNRGVAKEGLGDKAGAIADYETALTLDPKHEFAAKNLAQLRAGQTSAKVPLATDANSADTTSQNEGETTVFSNGNIYGVANGGTSPVFVLDRPTVITQIMNYHWNGGLGAEGGTIALRDSDGNKYGPWQVTVRNNTYWEVNRRITLPAGTYTVLDSDPATWAQNSQTNGKGMSVIKGFTVKGESSLKVDPGTTNSPTDGPVDAGKLAGKIISLPQPAYPAAAKAVGASGNVVVEVLVDVDGNVLSADAVSGHPLLRSAAENAARQAKFVPMKLAGLPVKFTGTVTYVFKL